MTDNVLRRWMASVPGPALRLGLAGLLPFIGLTALLLVVPENNLPFWRNALLAYGVAILSFMGGVQWGLSMLRDNQSWRGYSISVVPALVGWIALLFPPATHFPLLIVGFVLLLLYDLHTVRNGETPSWYPNLRWPLTVIVTLCLLVASLT